MKGNQAKLKGWARMTVSWGRPPNRYARRAASKRMRVLLRAGEQG